MPKLKLYELESSATWWVACFDELGVLSVIRAEMEDRDFNDVDIDFMLSDFEVNKIGKYEAEVIGVSTDGEIRSLWSLFVHTRGECVLGTSLDQDLVDLDGVDELNFDVDEY